MPRATTLHSHQTEHEKQLRTSSNSCELYRSQEIQLLSKIHQEVLLMSETEFDIYFAGVDWGATFDLFPKIEITYDPEFQELTKNED
tara:strand:+ start:387 stop:647 length:261 start_codon:yes stop_codon:yes gene_type:complete